MKKILLVITFSISCTIIIAQTNKLTQFSSYPAPEGAEASNDFSLEVNGEKVFVYNTREASFAYFSFQGKLDIKVIPGAFIYSYDIRPLSKKIKATVIRNELHFSIDTPMQLSIEINKNIKRPLFIFANSPEKNIPDKNSKDVLFFAPGKIYNIGKIKVANNQTIYIAGGAIVRGSFDLSNVQNAHITGRGIIDNSRYAKAETRPVAITHCNNISIDGIIITESKHWTCGSYSSTNVLYNNLNIVSANDWDDGIDIVASQHIKIENCFIRTKDDCIAIKSGVTYFGEVDHKNVSDVLVKDCVIWNGVWGNGLEIGFETSTDSIRDITFLDCDIIHTEGPEGTLTIHNGDHAYIKNIRYENINIEDAQGFLIDFKILNSKYSKDKERGKISDIFFKNIEVEGEHFPTSLLLGYDELHEIKNIKFDGLFINGRHITSTYDGMIATLHTDKISFE